MSLAINNAQQQQQQQQQYQNVFLEFVLANPDKQWNWRRLSSNPQITWKDFVDNPQCLWNANGMLENPNTTLGMIPMIDQYFRGHDGQLSVFPYTHLQKLLLFYSDNPSVAIDMLLHNTPSEYCTSNMMYVISRSDKTTIETLRQHLDLPWTHHTQEILENANFYGEAIRAELEKMFPGSDFAIRSQKFTDNPFMTLEDMKHELGMCYDTKNKSNCYFNLRCLTLQDMEEWKAVVNDKRPILKIFGSCPCVTLDILQKWLQEPNYTEQDEMTRKCCCMYISNNPNVTVDFIESHPEILWNYDALSLNAMGQHACFTDRHSSIASMYVLK